VTVPEISATEAHERLASAEPPRLIDVREAEEWAICRIEASELLPLSSWPQIARERLANPDEPLLVICHHGVRSAHAAQFLQQNGFTNVVNVGGGIEAWACRVDPTMARY
jgi:rhodanese-related sulfurtransferase